DDVLPVRIGLDDILRAHADELVLDVDSDGARTRMGALGAVLQDVVGQLGNHQDRCQLAFRFTIADGERREPSDVLYCVATTEHEHRPFGHSGCRGLRHPVPWFWASERFASTISTALGASDFSTAKLSRCQVIVRSVRKRSLY